MDSLPNSNNIDIEIFDENVEGKLIKGIKNVDKPRPTIDSLLGQWRRKILKTPDFQRKFVWTVKQSSRFIESLLLGVPIPSLMFYQDAESNQLVVDGQQRIKSIIFFIGDEKIDVDEDGIIKYAGDVRNCDIAENIRKLLCEYDDYEYRKSQSFRMQQVVDGKGAKRIAGEILRKLTACNTP